MTYAQHYQHLRVYKRCALCGAYAQSADDRLRALCECDNILLDYEPGSRVRVRDSGPCLSPLTDLHGQYGVVTHIDYFGGHVWVCVRMDCFDPDSSPIGFRADRIEKAYCHWEPPRPPVDMHGPLWKPQPCN